jgi:hypothetical protein
LSLAAKGRKGLSGSAKNRECPATSFGHGIIRAIRENVEE